MLKYILKSVCNLTRQAEREIPLTYDDGNLFCRLRPPQQDFLQINIRNSRISMLKEQSHKSHFRMWINKCVNADKRCQGLIYSSFLNIEFCQMTRWKFDARLLSHQAPHQQIIFIMGKQKYMPSKNVLKGGKRKVGNEENGDE